MPLSRSSVLGLLVSSAALAGCGSKIETLRDALVQDDMVRASALATTPPCVDATCLDPLARGLGSKTGFDEKNPDQASAAAVALLLVRDKRGDFVPDADRWITAMTVSRGQGADALRLAVAHGMAELAPRVGKRVDDEAEATALVHDMAIALPGACETYVALAKGGVAPMPPEMRPDHAPCVQHDLERKDGAGAAYGFGVWRAAAGVAALWKDEARALRAGLDAAHGNARDALEAKLAVIDAATAKMAFKSLPSAANAAWGQEMQQAHGVASAPGPAAPAPPASAAPSSSR
jgi:hypothetical protein